jgi:Tol biopolymer transport system component
VRRRGTIGICLALTAAGLQAPAGAHAAPEGATLLLSRPSGLGALPSTAVNNSFQGRNSVSADGRYVVFRSEADGLSNADDNALVNVFVRDRQTNTTEFVSRASTSLGPAANANSLDAVISADGTHVAFQTAASNLNSSDDNGLQDIYVRNLTTNTTTFVSRAHGVAGDDANQESTEPSISADGGMVAWSSRATDFADPLGADDPDVRDVFVRTGTTTRLMSRSTGLSAEESHEDSSDPAVSGDGTRVAFTSEEEFDLGVDTNAHRDVYVRTYASAATTLVSRADAGGDPVGDNPSLEAAINDDGTRIAFTSQAANLGDGDTNATVDVHVRDTSASTTELASRADGVAGALGDADSVTPAIDAAGDRVAFRTDATNLGGDTPGRQVYVRDLSGDDTALVSRATGASGTPATGSFPSIAAGGAVVTFNSDHDSVQSDDPNDFAHVYSRSIFAGNQTGLVSRPDGTGPYTSGANISDLSLGPRRAVSDDGRYVVFSSLADGLSPADSNDPIQVFRRDVATGDLVLISQGPGGAASNGNSRDPSISADGSRVAFETTATNLLSGGDPNGDVSDVLVRDVAAGSNTLVSRGDGEGGAPANLASIHGSISGDGTRVSFTSNSALAAGDADSIGDVFVRDLGAGTTTLVSTGPGGKGNSVSGNSAIDFDGSTVAFESQSSNLDPADNNFTSHLFVRDLSAGTTALVSRADGGGGAVASAPAGSPSISGDGTRVAFLSIAGNMGVGDGPLQDVFVRDIPASRTLLASRDGNGQAAASNSAGASMSRDGAKVAFASDSNLAGGSPSFSDAYVRDLAAGSTTLISRADGAGGAVGNGPATGPHLNGNGGCAAFASSGSNLVSGGYATTDFVQVYLRAVSGECPAVQAQSSGEPGAPAPAGDQSATPGTAADILGPVWERLALTNKSFRVGSARTPTTAGRRRSSIGTRFNWRLSEAATVTVRIDRALAGRRKGRRCVKPTRKLRKAKKCTRYTRAGTLTRTAAAGAGGTAFSGRIGRKALKPGKYRALVNATDAAGNKARQRTLSFTVVKR